MHINKFFGAYLIRHFQRLYNGGFQRNIISAFPIFKARVLCDRGHWNNRDSFTNIQKAVVANYFGFPVRQASAKEILIHTATSSQTNNTVPAFKLYFQSESESGEERGKRRSVGQKQHLGFWPTLPTDPSLSSVSIEDFSFINHCKVGVLAGQMSCSTGSVPPPTCQMMRWW